MPADRADGDEETSRGQKTDGQKEKNTRQETSFMYLRRNNNANLTSINNGTNGHRRPVVDDLAETRDRGRGVPRARRGTDERTVLTAAAAGRARGASVCSVSIVSSTGVRRATS